MAKDIYLDPITNDIALVNGVMRLTTNKEESSRQQILITLKTNLGEWVFNILAGIPFLANGNNPIQLLGAGNNKGLIDTLIKEAILSRENITQIISYTSDVDKVKRTMSVSFVAQTNSGEVVSVDNASLSI